MRQLGSLGDDGSTPRDINDRGQVVGYSRPLDRTHPYTLHAFLWEDGRIHDLNDLVTNLPPNVELEGAHAINEDGVIVGNTCRRYCSPGKTARSHGFVLIPDGMPVPTPQPMLLDTSYRAQPVTVAGTPSDYRQGTLGRRPALRRRPPARSALPAAAAPFHGRLDQARRRKHR